MRKLTIFKYIVLSILVLPIFYDHFNFLPKAAKYILDVLLIVYFVNSKHLLRRNNKFTKLYLQYVLAITLITFFSLVIHREGIFYFLQEIRRLLYPLAFYLIITDIFHDYEKSSIELHRLIILILVVQIPVTILQRVMFPYFKSMGVYADRGSINMMDIAQGTIGAGGASILGAIIPLVFVYFFDIKSFKSSFKFLIPLIIINSGGGIILFMISMTALTMYSLFKGSLKYRFKVLMGISTMVCVLLVFAKTEFFQAHIDNYIRSIYFYSEVYMKGGQETFGERGNKIDRFNGYKFLRSKMDTYEFEHLIGLGFKFKENGNNDPYEFKSDLNSIFAERGILGIICYLIFTVLFLVQTYRTIRKNGYKQGAIKILFFALFFLSTLYNATTRSFPVWLFVVFFLALLENKDQYIHLINYISGSNSYSNRQKRRKQTQKMFSQY